jgi:hypothetical protein
VDTKRLKATTITYEVNNIKNKLGTKSLKDL